MTDLFWDFQISNDQFHRILGVLFSTAICEAVLGRVFLLGTFLWKICFPGILIPCERIRVRTTLWVPSALYSWGEACLGEIEIVKWLPSEEMWQMSDNLEPVSFSVCQWSVSSTEGIVLTFWQFNGWRAFTALHFSWLPFILQYCLSHTQCVMTSVLH